VEDGGRWEREEGWRRRELGTGVISCQRGRGGLDGAELEKIESFGKREYLVLDAIKRTARKTASKEEAKEMGQEVR
jgi:hypothetical protein